ncbi:MAG: hypothetical protein JO197_08485 [Acidobacteria bacterium]|nr:hypothetical protein [Acidobacteriota bacterium]MBV9474657.1 hypothetical protein [Acidobacteriota bacterium]
MFAAAALITALAMPALAQQQPSPLTDSMRKLETELVAKYGEAQRPRLVRGMNQVAQFWRAEDGDAAAFEDLVRTHFAGDQATLDALFDRLEFLFESYGGHMTEITRDLRRQSDLDIGPIYPFDEILAGYDPTAHFSDDLFQNKLAFVVLLNFPVTTLQQRLTEGETWTRRQWAEAALALGFTKRVPADVNAAISQAGAEAAQYVATYNIWMHHLVDDKGNRIFPAKMRLLEHWNLRDEIKGNYSLDPKVGLPKQRMIQRVMERIVDESIPQAVIDNPNVDWNPYTNTVAPAAVKDSEPNEGRPAPASLTNAREPDTRYAKLLGEFRAVKRVDPYSPTAPTYIQRSFEEGRQMLESRVRSMLEEMVSSPLVPRVAQLIEKRLGRPLEPFDIWYNGFRANSAYSEADLDAITRKKYPTPEAYKADMANLFVNLGFTKERADYLAANIEVDPARGSGHAMGSARRADNPHLRTRVGKEGMDYKGYNIAIHEMGHNVEQVFSLKNIDYYSLYGVPNTAFTEALAFTFQNRDLELLGLAKPTPESQAMATLNEFWNTYEISGIALVDMGVWHWMYDHPSASPEELKNATVQIAKDVWNRYYAPVFHNRKDVVLLGIYAHMIDSFLYLPNYPIGHLIAFQIQEQMEKAGNFGAEFERMAKYGSVAPDLWMKNATGAPVGAAALLRATERALTVVK